MRRLRWSAAAAAIGAVSAVPATAAATPAVGVEARTISQATVDGVDYITREITVAPGGSAGWHYHDGRVFGVIRAGTLIHDAATCTVDGIYPPGAPLAIDAPDPGCGFA